MEQFNVCFLKQPLAVIKTTEAAIDRCFLIKTKSKKAGKILQIKFTGCRLLVLKFSRLLLYEFLKKLCKIVKSFKKRYDFKTKQWAKKGT